MTYVPRPGLALIRRITTGDTVPGGVIVLTEATRDFLTAGQCELIDIGSREPLEDPDETEEQVWPELETLRSGAWLLLRHRTWIETDRDDLFLVRHEDILAVLS